ncbi:MAG TPA: PDZ domain-containing protein [Planctomycetota bacterium]|jgi:hypothetical protein|nr:PDZ domain-containing protein [Planctomycetota bacterium]
MTNPVLDDNLRRLFRSCTPRLSEEDLERAYARFEGRRRPAPRHGRVLAGVAALLVLGLLGWLARSAPPRPMTPAATPQQNSPDDIARLIADLGSASPELREKAKNRLVAMGPDALGPLERALYHEDPEIREQSQAVAKLARRHGEIQSSLAFVRAAVKIVRAHWSARDFTDINKVVDDAFDPQPPVFVHYAPRKSVGDAFDIPRESGQTLNIRGLMIHGDGNRLTPAMIAALDQGDGILYLSPKGTMVDLSEFSVFTLPDKVGWSAYVVVAIPELADPEPFLLNLACQEGELSEFSMAATLAPRPGGGVKLSDFDPRPSRVAKAFKKGDVVRSVNNTPVNAAADLVRLAVQPPGKVMMTVDRDGKVFNVQFQILRAVIVLKTGPKAEADAKKIFEEAENLLAENPKHALELYQQLQAEYMKTEISTTKKIHIEERIAQLKSK